ncbi:thiolase-like protein [Baffinella frigidus]|nr:thiolase-like protein [Cryptophyta sp. CCMP2293]
MRARSGQESCDPQVDHVVAGYCYGDSACGQRCVYELGMTGVPVINVNNNCATGGTALYLAKMLVQGGQSECVLVVGFEKMEAGSLAPKFPDRENPVEQHFHQMAKRVGGATAAPPTPQMFGNAAREHMRKYGSTEEHLAKIAAKNHANGQRNPRAQSRVTPTPQEVLASKMVFPPLTKLQ